MSVLSGPLILQISTAVDENTAFIVIVSSVSCGLKVSERCSGF